MLGLVTLSQNPSRLVVRHMTSQESPEILMNLLTMITFLDISAIQLLCWYKEVASSGAGHIVARALARDGTIFATFTIFVQLEPFGDHRNLLAVELGVPLV